MFRTSWAAKVATALLAVVTSHAAAQSSGATAEKDSSARAPAAQQQEDSAQQGTLPAPEQIGMADPLVVEELKEVQLSHSPDGLKSARAACAQGKDLTQENNLISYSVCMARRSVPVPVQNRMLTVGAPKIYDDYYLRQMLTGLQTQLAGVHAVDQATLLSHIGVAQGGTLDQVSGAVSATGMPTVGTSTFALAPGVQAVTFPPGYTGTTPAGGTPPSAYPTGTATATTPGTTTTVGSVTPTAPTTPTPTLALPTLSSFGQSSLDTLNESLQLQSEITNASLLLQGALSDSLTRDGKPKHTITIGFPITVGQPDLKDKRLADAAAQVNVTFCPAVVDGDEAPSIATLLPQERTYNVASLVDKDFSASLGAVLGNVVNIGGGILWSHKRYYLVQQQETVALFNATPDARCAGNPNAISFAWQIHPVLGKDFIRPGNTVNFVQFAVSPSGNSDFKASQYLGIACVSVDWIKPAHTGFWGGKSDVYFQDPKRSAISSPCFAIFNYSLFEEGPSLKQVAVSDAGQGNVTVTAKGTFLPGMTVRIGSTYVLPDPNPADHESLVFTAPASAIVAASQVEFVDRNNQETVALNPCLKEFQCDANGDPLTMQDVAIEPFSDSQTLVKVKFNAPKEAPGDKGAVSPKLNPWVVVIGGKVFGLSDAPFRAQSANSIELIVPTDLIQKSPRVEMERLLWSGSYHDSKDIPEDTFSKALPAVSGTSILSNQNGLTLGLVGSGLDQVRLEFPSQGDCAGCTLDRVGPTYATLNLRKKQDDDKRAKDAKNQFDPASVKQVVLCKFVSDNDKDHCSRNFTPLIVDVPKLDTPASKPSCDNPDPIPVNTTQVSLTGTLLDQVVSIEHAKQTFNFRYVDGKKPSLTLDIPSAINSVAGGYGLLLTFADKTTTGCLLSIKPKGN